MLKLHTGSTEYKQLALVTYQFIQTYTTVQGPSYIQLQLAITLNIHELSKENHNIGTGHATLNNTVHCNSKTEEICC
jgi:hypothetical protein